jgi:hypothetical protein
MQQPFKSVLTGVDKITIDGAHNSYTISEKLTESRAVVKFSM